MPAFGGPHAHRLKDAIPLVTTVFPAHGTFERQHEYGVRVIGRVLLSAGCGETRDSPLDEPLHEGAGVCVVAADAIWVDYQNAVDFTAISQPWLRAAAKRWAVQDLLRRRGVGVTSVLRAHIAAARETGLPLVIHCRGRVNG